MSFISLPAELQLLVIAFLPTRDIVVLGHTCRHLRAIAEDERAKRQDINRLLSRYVDHPEDFRRLMRDTEAIIVGEFAKAFFTGEDPPKELELLFPLEEIVDIEECEMSWTSFFGHSLSQPSLERVNDNLHWIQEVGRSDGLVTIHFQWCGWFPAKEDRAVSLRFPLRNPFEQAAPISSSPECRSFMDADGPSRWNHVAWNTAFCAYPHLLLTESSVPDSGTIFDKYSRHRTRLVISIQYHLALSDRSVPALRPDPWTLELSELHSDT